MATIALTPNGNYSVTATRNGCTNNYECVDEYPAADDATTYLHAPYSTTKVDQYTFTDCGLSNVTINHIYLVARYSSQGGANQSSWVVKGVTGAQMGTGGWMTVQSGGYSTDPSTAQAWTPTTLDSIYAGVSIVSGSANYGLLSQVYIIVDYTQFSVPTLSTTAISPIWPRSAKSGGSISSNGGAAVTESGICWNTTGTPTTSSSKTTGGGTGSFTHFLTGLRPRTTYHVRAYATNSVGTGYGSEIDFTTDGQSQIIGF